MNHRRDKKCRNAKRYSTVTNFRNRIAVHLLVPNSFWLLSDSAGYFRLHAGFTSEFSIPLTGLEGRGGEMCKIPMNCNNVSQVSRLSTRTRQGLLSYRDNWRTGFGLWRWLFYGLLRRVMIALMMEAVSTSETSVNFNQTTQRNNPEDDDFHTRRRKNLKSHLVRIRGRIGTERSC
jgi:hypothetical protein